MALLGTSGVAWKGASLANEALKAFRVSNGSADRDLCFDREELLMRSRSLFQNNMFAVRFEIEVAFAVKNVDEFVLLTGDTASTTTGA